MPLARKKARVLFAGLMLAAALLRLTGVSWDDRRHLHPDERFLSMVADGIAEVRRSRPELGILLITHYQRILDHLTPDVVHVLLDGRIVATGGPELAQRIETGGFDSFKDEVAA